MTDRRLRVGIDSGGTFTDFVTSEGKATKVPSDAHAPGAVIEAGCLRPELGCDGAASVTLIHGTTVATNALLTGDLPPVGIVTTRGFRDVLALGRQNRPELYDLSPRPRHAFPARHLVLEVDERIDARGRVLRPLDVAELQRVGRRLVAQGVEALAVCFLHSWRNPIHERQAVTALAECGVPVIASSAVVPQYREFERFSTTWADAGLRPLIQAYVHHVETHLRRLQRGLGVPGRPTLLFMQSGGGTATAAEVVRRPVDLVLSGPAGGVIGAWAGAATRSRRRLITLDMGGTSTDVALLDGDVATRGSCEIAGRPLLVPVLDVHTIGAGGGSIARRDSGGALVVGPQSAGAAPGPACYGKGGPATVTDANLVLGRLLPDAFLGGRMSLDRDAAHRAIDALGREFGVGGREIALGVVAIAEAAMARALRSISSERGHDPGDFALVAFGGAGALHAVALAAMLGIREVVVPAAPGLLSAVGMLCARPLREVTRTVDRVALGRLEARPGQWFAALEARARRSIGRQSGTAVPAVAVERSVDLRYVGQSHELTVPLGRIGETAAAFVAVHRRRFGFVLDTAAIEVVNLRLRLTGAADPPPKRPLRRAKGPPEPVAHVKVAFPDGTRRVAVHDRARLLGGARWLGPSIITEMSATTLVPAGCEVTVERFGALSIRVPETKS